jgi:hypothetical protein
VFEAEKCERFSKSGNLNFKKSTRQSLYFLSINFCKRTILPPGGSFQALDFWTSFLDISGLSFHLFSSILELLDLNNRFRTVWRISVHETRALQLVWDPIVGNFRQKCERFSHFCNLNFKKSPPQDLNFFSKKFLCGSWGVLELGPWTFATIFQHKLLIPIIFNLRYRNWLRVNLRRPLVPSCNLSLFYLPETYLNFNGPTQINP